MMNDVWRCVQNRPTSVIAEPFDVSTRLVNGRNHPQPVEPSEFEVLLSASGAMWTIPVPSSAETSFQATTECWTSRLFGQRLERPMIGESNQIGLP